MRLPRTVNDLIELAAVNAPTRACERCIRSDGATAFRVRQGAAGLPGWIVRARTPGRTFLIGLWVDEAARRVRCTYPDELPEDAKEVEGQRL